MSRSFKKVPLCKDNSRGMKKIANRTVRRQGFLGKGSYYKKVFESWNIHDYKFTSTFEEFVNNTRQYNHEMSLRGYSCKEETTEELYKVWYKMYKMK